VAVMKITVGYLYPDIMSTYGDRGNVETLLRRCEWRDISTEVTELRLGDKLQPDELDLIVIGGGGESQQRLIASDLHKIKAAGIRAAVIQGAAALAVGGGFELLGRFCQPEQGAEFRGAELFDTWTIRQRAVLGNHYENISEARADRIIGDLVVRWGDKLLVGFENHSGGTYLGATARPLGQVISGYGNNGDGTEGVILAGAIGTNLRGPCLPKNPALADFLIATALRRRYQDAQLAPLPDELERAAHEVAIARVRQTRRASRGRLVRPAWLRAVPHQRRSERRPAGRAGQVGRTGTRS
jgi:lipid II isoglutaminyl synthase (glutamine-hydrolysing)